LHVALGLVIGELKKGIKKVLGVQNQKKKRGDQLDPDVVSYLLVIESQKRTRSVFWRSDIRIACCLAMNWNAGLKVQRFGLHRKLKGRIAHRSSTASLQLCEFAH
jgi:hypothetical protein